MAIPIADFSYQSTGLVVDFTDGSNNLPTGWAWDFGDGNPSILQNPQHTFDSGGTYEVSLVASNVDGASEPLLRTLTVVVAPSTLYIQDFLDCDLPEGLTIEGKCKDILTRKWQLHLQILIDPNILDEDVHDDSALTVNEKRLEEAIERMEKAGIAQV